MINVTRKRIITAQDNYFWLLFSLLVLFFFSALFEQLGNEALARVIGVFLTAIILVAVWTLEKARIPFYSRMGASGLLVLLVLMEYLFDHYSLALLQLFTILVFVISTIVIASKQVLLSGDVTLNNIVGAICIYIFMAMAWAMAFLLVEHFFPGSIPGLEGGDWRAELQKSMYFSFVTITTLGFGDISPVQPLARYLTYLEAITGQFYTAILVASLVGVHLAGKETKAST